MGAPKIPAAPDPAVITANQTASNKATLHATQAAQSVDQNTDYGNLKYAITGQDPEGNPLYTATSNLSADQKALLDQLETSQQGLGDQGGGLVQNTNYDQAPDFSEMAGTQTKANMDRYASYMEPTYTQQREQLDNNLRNQGLVPGSEAYDRAMRTQSLNQNQSTAAALNQYQSNAFNQAQTQYTQPLDTLGKIFGLTSPASLPNNFVGTPKPTMNPTDVVGATKVATDQQNQIYQMQAQKYNSMMSGIFGVAKAGMGFM